MEHYSFDDPPTEDDAETDQNENVDTPYENQNTGYAANPHQNKFVYNEMTYDKEVLAAKFNRCYHSMIDFSMCHDFKQQLKKIEESFAQEWKVVDDLLGFSDLDDLRGLHDRVFSRYGLSPNSLVVVGAIVAVGVAVLGVAEHRRGHHSGTEIQNILRQRLEVGDREVDIEQCRVNQFNREA
ncbi:hypothetical protein JHK87_022647 [Glycine soja]|nr:hypothetical protein JHK87_022647 [Glycine soja]